MSDQDRFDALFAKDLDGSMPRRLEPRAITPTPVLKSQRQLPAPSKPAPSKQVASRTKAETSKDRVRPDPQKARRQTSQRPVSGRAGSPSIQARDFLPVAKLTDDGKEILVCPAPPRPGQTPIDALMGLAVRAALAVQFGSWALGNAVPVHDLLDWRAWLQPVQGLEVAVSVWTMNRIDPEFGAFVLLLVAGLITLSASLGLFARLAGLLVVIGACWHAMFVLPEAWPAAFSHGVLGFYLAMRGAGPISLDWILARLSRLG